MVQLLKYDSVEIWLLQNLMKIGWQLTEKSTKNMRSWLITFNVTLGIVGYLINVTPWKIPPLKIFPGGESPPSKKKLDLCPVSY